MVYFVKKSDLLIKNQYKSIWYYFISRFSNRLKNHFMFLTPNSLSSKYNSANDVHLSAFILQIND